jgi:hypothetical protein
MKQRQLTDGVSSRGARCSTVSEIAEQVQADDRMRLLEPTSLPKVLRGFKHRPPPNTALLSRIAFEAFKARMWADGLDLDDEQALAMFKGEARCV